MPAVCILNRIKKKKTMMIRTGMTLTMTTTDDDDDKYDGDDDGGEVDDSYTYKLGRCSVRQQLQFVCDVGLPSNNSPQTANFGQTAVGG